MKFSAVQYRDTYRIVASVSWYVSYHDFAGDTQHYYTLLCNTINCIALHIYHMNVRYCRQNDRWQNDT